MRRPALTCLAAAAVLRKRKTAEGFALYGNGEQDCRKSGFLDLQVHLRMFPARISRVFGFPEQLFAPPGHAAPSLNCLT